MTRNVIIFLLSLLMAGSFAQTPHTFYFQGALKDSDGKPVNDTKFIEFLIYDIETGGEAVWSEGPLSVEIIEGLFSHELGSTIPFPEGLFDTNPLYVTFALASGEMLPRQKLTSVPYALKSYLGDDDWEATGNYLINLTDSIGIGTSSPKTRFEVNDLMRLTPIGMDEECDLDLEGSIYYDENLKEFCFCNGDYWYQMDGDGYCECVDLDGDGVDICEPEHPYDTDGLIADCDDENPDVYPGNVELCDGVDNNCDGLLGEEEYDADGDGYVVCSIDPGGWDGDPAIIGGDDCDDGNPFINPGAIEACDGLDSNCDGTIDPSEEDQDGDGFVGCDTESWAVVVGGDCNDNEVEIFPGAIEKCNGIDDNCDGQSEPWEIDDDGDGYVECDIGPAGWQGDPSVIGGDDCDDGYEFVNPGMEEICDNDMDDDCDGDFDMWDMECWSCFDEDGDGYGVAPWSGIANGCQFEEEDCNNEDPDIYPGAPEIPDDGIDQDCDGYDATVCYVDNDMDSYGNDEGTTVVALDGTCSLALQQSSNFLDCDDNNAEIYPDASEVCGNGLDDDCDTELDMDDSDCQYCIDNDGDGFGEEPHAGISNGCPFNDPDCDDGNAAINPMATEIPDDGIDQDCDGYDATICFADYDQDGYGNDAGTTIIAWNGICHPADFGSTNDQDCDDEDPDINPEAEDIPDDGIDQNCNNYDATVCFQDNDQDGFGNISGATVVAPDGICDLAQQESTNDLDCDDGNATIYPGATEVCDNFIDDDCDNQVDINDPDCSVCVDNDMDGYGQAPFSGTASGCPMEGDDCDDEDPGIHPGASEVCFNGFDDDCDDLVDMDDPDCVTCVDNDGDGYGAAPNSGTANGCTFDGDDCDDGNDAINPGATEVCGNAVDDDCDNDVDNDDSDCGGQ